MEISAMGSATRETRRKLFSRKAGKGSLSFEYITPVKQARIRGLDTVALIKRRNFSVVPYVDPEYQIRVETASRLMNGITTPIVTANTRTPSSPRAVSMTAIPT